MDAEPMTKKLQDDSGEPSPMGPSIILVEPQLGENIGTAARAMANFGLHDLRLVAPRDGWPNEKAQSSASEAKEIVDSARLFPSTEMAIQDIHKVFATTARPRDMIKNILAPEAAARKIHQLAGQQEKTALLFGCERSGLKNDDIALADSIIMAPVDQNFASLNLAQAVLLISYEWKKQDQKQTLGRKTRYDGPGREGLHLCGTQPATKKELLHFFEHLESELDHSGFLKPAEKRSAMVRNIRNMFQRMEITEQEVRTLRGIVKSLVHFGHPR